MGKQKGLIKLVGNIGGMSFYVANGEYLVRMAGGPTKERIQRDPNFVRTRENNVEFGGAAKVAKAFRTALKGILPTMAGSRLTSELTKIFRAINQKGTGVRGKRSISLSAHKELLSGLHLDKRLRFTGVFGAPYTVVANADRNRVTFSIPAFIPTNHINAPAGATHFKLIAAIGLVSDYNYTDVSGTYAPDVPQENALGVVQGSTLRALDTGAPPFALTVIVPYGIVPDDAISIVACLGIEFYQKVGGDDYLLSQGNAMMVTQVF